jgi:hypothetical protein
MRIAAFRQIVSALGWAALTVTGCSVLGRGGGDSRDFQITSNQDVYSRGNTGEATFRNTTDETLEYNLCPRRLERQANKYWVVAFEWPTAGGACTTEARSLGKGQSVSALFEIPTGVPTGTYRLVFTGLLGKNGKSAPPDQAATPAFQVR